MAESYSIPDTLLCVHLSTRQARPLRHLPEYSRPSTLRILPIRIDGDHAGQLQTMMVFDDEVEIDAGISILLESDLPILGFNLFNHAYRALAHDYKIAPLIPRSIDLFLGLWLLANEKSIKANGTRTSSSGDLKLASLMFDNFADYAPSLENPARCKEVADLWIKTLTFNRINIGGEEHKLSKSVGLKLLGHEKFFDEPKTWASSLIMSGSVLGVPARGHNKYRTKVFEPRYRKFID